MIDFDGLKNTDTDMLTNTDWLNSAPGKIYARLKKIAEKRGQIVKVQGANSSLVEYIVGNQSAALHIDVTESQVGDEQVKSMGSIESWEYKRFPWWNETINSAGIPLNLLDPPLAWVARDGQTSDENVFKPNQVVKQLPLTDIGDAEKLEQAKQRVIQTIISTVVPVVQPDYSVAYHHGSLRLQSLTAQARESLEKDNNIYLNAAQNLAKITPVLKTSLSTAASQT